MRHALLVLALVLAASAPHAQSSGAFVEQNGLVVIELESEALFSNWQQESEFVGSTGDGYIIWRGSQFLGNPGVAILRYPVQISTPGTYRFDWRNAFGQGTSPTDHNDTWLKIEGASFYGVRGASVVCPRGFDATQNDCTGGDPEGAGANGWFKVYRSSGTRGVWSWAAFTSDNDGHVLFARFDTPGTYEIQVSPRSSSHAVDRMILVHEGYTGAPRDLSLPESARSGGTSSADGPDARRGLVVSPNPTSGAVVVRYDTSAGTATVVEVVDRMGRRVLGPRPMPAGGGRLDTSGLAAGLYVVRVVSGSEVVTRPLAVVR